MKKYFFLLPLLLSRALFAQTPDQLSSYFESASAEFNVPAPLLESIGYVQTRWHQLTYTDSQLANRPSDVQPPLFGVMGLRDDDWFGHSLTDAATLLGKPVTALKDDAFQNIRGAAALLSSYRDQANKDSAEVTDDLSTWAGVVARFSGIPQKDIADEFAYHVLQTAKGGINERGIVIPPQPINLSGFPESVKEKGYRSGRMKTSAVVGGGADYPGATWDPSPNFDTRPGVPVVFVIIHDTEGPFDASVSWLKNPSAQASAHYVIRSNDGYIDQLVHDADEAWAVRCWNPITLNIEHEGYVADSSYFTETMYEASAHLTEYLCRKFNIPEDSIHVFGHNAWTYPWFNLIPFGNYVSYVGAGYATCNNHTDPGKYWKWHHYFDLIHSYDTTKPYIASARPAGETADIPAYATPTITFNVPMDPTSLYAACKVTPRMPGVPMLDVSGMKLNFTHPDSLLAWSTKYTITIDTTAKATNGTPLSSPFIYSFTTVPIDTTGPGLLAASPRVDGSSVSKAYMEFVLDEPIQYNSLPSRITFTDSTGKNIGFGKDLFQVTDNNLTLIGLRSLSPLAPGMRYTASLAPGLVDLYGNVSKTTYSITFTVDTSDSTGGKLVEGFETSAGAWTQPKSSTLTTGTDTTLSTFSLTSKCYDGSEAGMLRYSFDSTQALCAVENSNGIDVSSSGSFGMWIFGDNSGNELDLIFGSPARYVAPVDTINWYGWKYVGMWRDKGDVSTSILKGFAVRHLESALLDSSSIYVDDIQVSGKANSFVGIPTSTSLFQNYPNPFNPTTDIIYQLSTATRVSVKIYDVLGREVRTLMDESQGPGLHVLSFNATGLPSGVYFCRMDAGSFSQTRKMILMK